MSILVIGCGLVGSQVIKRLLEIGEEVIGMDVSPKLDALSDIFDVSKTKIIRADILNPHDVYRVVKENGVKKIIHLAANPLLTVGAQRDPYEALMVNVVGTANILEVCRLMDIERLVFASSNVINIYVKDSPVHGKRPSTVYASTKLFCEHLCYNYHDLYGIDFIALRFAAVFGPWRYGGGGLPTRSFMELVDNVLRGRPAKVPPSEDYIYSKDAAEACVKALIASSPNRRIYEIGMGRIYTQDEIKSIMEKLVPGCRLVISEEPLFTPRPQPVPVDLKPAREELGFEPKFDMEKALKDYITWYKSKIIINNEIMP